MGREGRGGKGRSPCLPPRFDNPGYGPVRGGKGGRKGRKGKGRGGKGGREEREEKGKGGERHLALPPPEKKILAPPLRKPKVKDWRNVFASNR